MSRAMRVVLSTAACVVLVAGATAVLADHPEGPMKPTAEHKKLSYFVGKWSSEVQVKENPFMPAGTYTSRDTCEWFEGGFAVVCNAKGKGPMGAVTSVGVMSYSPEEKVYSYFGYDSTGMAMLSVPRGTVEGGTWTYNDESKMMGKTVKSRYIIKEKSPTSYTFKWEMMGENGSWMTLMEGTSTK